LSLQLNKHRIRAALFSINIYDCHILSLLTKVKLELAVEPGL
jgi:hypothetical protein